MLTALEILVHWLHDSIQHVACPMSFWMFVGCCVFLVSAAQRQHLLQQDPFQRVRCPLTQPPQPLPETAPIRRLIRLPDLVASRMEVLVLFAAVADAQPAM